VAIECFDDAFADWFGFGVVVGVDFDFELCEIGFEDSEY
jgi:hypothetical protein